MKYQFYPNCLIVKGHKRSIIYDLFRWRYKIVPNELAGILLCNQRMEIAQFSILPENKEQFICLIKQLKEEDYIYVYEIDSHNIFSELDMDYSSPELISSLVVEMSHKNKMLFDHIVFLTQKFGIRNIHLRCSDNLDSSMIDIVSKATKRTQLEYIEFSTLGNLRVDKCMVRSINYNSRISVVYASKFYEEKKIPKLKWCRLIRLNSGTHQNAITQRNSFKVNLSHYTEAQNYNTYFNKKLFINGHGEIVSNL